jgi:hypothetical protein
MRLAARPKRRRKLRRWFEDYGLTIIMVITLLAAAWLIADI